MGKTGALTSKMSDGKRRNVIRKRGKTGEWGQFPHTLPWPQLPERERERKALPWEKKSFRKTFPPHPQARWPKPDRKNLLPFLTNLHIKGFFVAPLPPTVSGGEFYQRVWMGDGPAALVIPLSNAEYVRTCTCIKHIEKGKPKTFFSRISITSPDIKSMRISIVCHLPPG